MNPPLHRRLQSAALLAAFFCQTLVPLLPAQSAGVPQLLNYQGRVTVAATNFNGTGYFKFSLVDGGTDQNRTAAAVAAISAIGRLNGVILSDGGRGYVTPPGVSFAGTGTGATATAILTGDAVTAVNVNTEGGGFSTITPTQVVFTSPPPNVQTATLWSNDGTGNSGAEPVRAAVPLTVNKGLYSVLLGDESLMEPLPPQIFANPDVRLRVWFSQTETGPFTLLTPDQRIAAVGYALMADNVRDGAITSSKLAADAITLAQLSPGLRQTIEGLQEWQATQLPIVTSAATASAALDLAFSYQITATGLPTSFAVGGLLAGWTVNPATGLITATPSAAGTVTLSLTATNVAGTSSPKILTVNVAGPVFVDYATGDDGNAGTQAAPVKTVAQGIAVARAAPANRPVRVSGAAQTLTSQLQLKGNVPVRGGYDRAAGWTHTAPRTPLNYAPSGNDGVAVVAENLTAPTLLDGFAITSVTPSGTGLSSIGVRVRTCPQEVTISNDTVTTGNGTTGQPMGISPAGATGADGWDATSWEGPSYPYYGANLIDSPESFWGTGGQYLSAQNFFGTQISFSEGFPGHDGFGALGGTGGTGGSPGVQGGAAPGNGGNGTTGGKAGAGNNGTATTGIHLTANFTSDRGGDGHPGFTGGEGGSGGGGGGGVTGPGQSTLWYGGGGGTGGHGGEGGVEGRGGNGGGGAFAIVVVASKVTVTGCTLTTGNGGTGGAGGRGGVGGNGGNGGSGHVTPVYLGINPGNGGNGGHGGEGGGGGGGAGGQGGPSIGIIANTASTMTLSGNTFTLGAAGTGGTGGLQGESTTSHGETGSTGLRQNFKLNVPAQ